MVLPVGNPLLCIKPVRKQAIRLCVEAPPEQPNGLRPGIKVRRSSVRALRCAAALHCALSLLMIACQRAEGQHACRDEMVEYYLLYPSYYVLPRGVDHALASAVANISASKNAFSQRFLLDTNSRECQQVSLVGCCAGSLSGRTWAHVVACPCASARQGPSLHGSMCSIHRVCLHTWHRLRSARRSACACSACSTECTMHACMLTR